MVILRVGVVGAPGCVERDERAGTVARCSLQRVCRAKEVARELTHKRVAACEQHDVQRRAPRLAVRVRVKVRVSVRLRGRVRDRFRLRVRLSIATPARRSIPSCSSARASAPG